MIMITDMCAAVFRAAATRTDVTRPRNFNSWQIFLSLGSPLLIIGSLHVCWLAPKSFGIIELDLSLWALVLPQTTNINPKVAKIYLILLVFYMYIKHVISTISPSSTVTKRNKGSAHSHAHESNISAHSCEVRQITIIFWGPYKLPICNSNAGSNSAHCCVIYLWVQKYKGKWTTTAIVLLD